jgi:hypothetical protein
MTPEALLKEVQRICTMIDNPNEDNTAGRVEIHRYDVLPQLLVANRHIVLKALKQLCQKDTQIELNVLT